LFNHVQDDVIDKPRVEEGKVGVGFLEKVDNVNSEI